MNDYTAQTRAAMATIALLIDGPQKASELAAQLYDSEQNGWHLLNNISQPLGLTNDNGWWYVQVTPFSNVRHLYDVVSARIDETLIGHAYCRPLPRRDMLQIQDLLRHLIKIGTPPER